MATRQSGRFDAESSRGARSARTGALTHAAPQLRLHRRAASLGSCSLKVKNARFGSIARESTALVRAASSSQGRVVGLLKKDAVLRELSPRSHGTAFPDRAESQEDTKTRRREDAKDFVFLIMRRERDSNPRYPCEHT